MNSNVKIDKIIIEHVIDTHPDTSWLGEYTSDLDDGIIVRQYDKFYEDLTEEEIEEITTRTREHTGFRPYAGGEKIGTKEYKEYGMQDYERMEKINNGSIWFIGIVAKAIIFVNGTRQHIFSGGLWRIESDSDSLYIEEIENGQLSELKEQLEALIVGTINFDNIKIERKC